MIQNSREMASSAPSISCLATSRMQEYLQHCANYYERYVERQISGISDVKSSNQKLLAKILPPHVVPLVSDARLRFEWGGSCPNLL